MEVFPKEILFLSSWRMKDPSFWKSGFSPTRGVLAIVPQNDDTFLFYESTTEIQ